MEPAQSGRSPSRDRGGAHRSSSERKGDLKRNWCACYGYTVQCPHEHPGAPRAGSTANEINGHGSWKQEKEIQRLLLRIVFGRYRYEIERDGPLAPGVCDPKASPPPSKSAYLHRCASTKIRG